MTDYLLDADLVVELLSAPAESRDALLAAAERRGDGLWIYLGAVNYVIERLSASMPAADAAAALRGFGQRINWLSVLADDAGFIDQRGLLGAQRHAMAATLGEGARQMTVDGAGDSVMMQDYLGSRDADGPVAFIDLPRQQRRIRANVERGLLAVLGHGRYIGGPEIDCLERRLAEYVGVRHAVAVSNGTDALLIALMASGVGAGDEVITSPFTFAATGEMIHLLGARPVYVDIDPVTYNLDHRLLEGALSERTRAILPVSIFGQCPDIESINAIAAARGIPVIEDAAQSFGAVRNGRRSCGLSDIGCTSFFPSKPLGGYGDSGACFTDSDEIADALRQVRDHGQTGRYRHTRLGINGRMSSFQASVLLAKMEVFEDEVERRSRVGATYDRLFAELGGDLTPDRLTIPRLAAGNTSVYAQYSLLVSDRDQTQRRLGERGVPSAVHYPVPLYRQPAMRQQGVELPVCESVSDRVLSIPMHPYLTRQQQHRVAAAVVDSLSAA